MFDRHAKTALIVTCALLALGSIGLKSAVRSLDLYLRKEPVSLRSQLDNIATTLGSWQMVAEAPKLSAEMVEELGTDRYLDRRYAPEGRGGWLSLHIAYYTGMIDAVPHVPDRCMVAGGFNARSRPENVVMELDRRGWQEGPTAPDDAAFETFTYADPVTGSPVTVHMPFGDFALRTTEFSHDDMPNARIYAGYFFIANGRIAVTPEDVKRAAFRKSEKYAYYCKVQFFATGEKDLTPEQFVARSAEFTEALLPELMRCLPDWPEVLAPAEPRPPAAVGLDS